MTLTSLLPVGSSVASLQRHGGQELGEMHGRAEVWHRVAEVEQVLEAVSERTRGTFRGVVTQTQPFQLQCGHFLRRPGA